MLNFIYRWFYPAKSAEEIIAEYHIPEKINFQFESTDDGWIVATSPDLPGFITEAKNPQELYKMINDGILTYFDVPKELGDIVHENMTLDGSGTFSLKHWQKQTA